MPRKARNMINIYCLEQFVANEILVFNVQDPCKRSIVCPQYFPPVTDHTVRDIHVSFQLLYSKETIHMYKNKNIHHNFFIQKHIHMSLDVPT